MTDTPSSGRFRGFVARIFTILGMMTFGLIVLVVVGALLSRTERVPRQVILELDLEDGLIENVPPDPIGAILRRDQLTVRDAIEALKRGETDDRVRGLVARVGSGGVGMAQVEELRAAVASFRASGKPAILFSETFGEFAPGRSDYYLASAFEEIHLQPSGDVGLAGFISEVPFVAGAFERFGIQPQMASRHEYKDALNLFTEEEMTEPQREATTRVLTGIYDNLVTGIAAGRGLSPDQVRRLIDEGPYFGEEAVRAGLVDRLSYRDEVYDSLQARVGGEFLYAQHYVRRAGRPHRRGPEIALIYGTGAVMRGESEVNPLVGGAVLGSETVTRAFREAIENDRIRAIVFRVDSPGGSYVASDAIWRETVRARDAGKPVIVTMGNVAGSGGYFVAMGADRIVAHPSTITGSIGVYGGKMLIGELTGNLGITWDDARVGGNATMWSVVEEYSPAEWARLQTSLDRIYTDFTAKVAQGRGLSPDSAHAVARGRIWSGTDALRIGLVDELGGFDVALRLARELAGIDPDESIKLTVYPRERSIVEMLLRPRASSSYPTRLESSLRLIASLHPILQHVEELGLLRPAGVLTMPQMPPVR